VGRPELDTTNSRGKAACAIPDCVGVGDESRGLGQHPSSRAARPPSERDVMDPAGRRSSRVSTPLDRRGAADRQKEIVENAGNFRSRDRPLRTVAPMTVAGPTRPKGRQVGPGQKRGSTMESAIDALAKILGRRAMTRRSNPREDARSGLNQILERSFAKRRASDWRPGHSRKKPAGIDQLRSARRARRCSGADARGRQIGARSPHTVHAGPLGTLRRYEHARQSPTEGSGANCTGGLRLNPRRKNSS